jgi:hypothetical protein
LGWPSTFAEHFKGKANWQLLTLCYLIEKVLLLIADSIFGNDRLNRFSVPYSAAALSNELLEFQVRNEDLMVV